ncbi:hypothetical protein NDU88_002190 [Pleurodeles waltl]|uniref:Uncharacterized protein n=1 Tax=Pleurodeles waltl TaxID=8319 RepID=A0AAV7T2T4_PLEWA|nr:hypothetical protein NDU88_002190 [Pleurodeles waltl]
MARFPSDSTARVLRYRLPDAGSHSSCTSTRGGPDREHLHGPGPPEPLVPGGPASRSLRRRPSAVLFSPAGSAFGRRTGEGSPPPSRSVLLPPDESRASRLERPALRVAALRFPLCARAGVHNSCPPKRPTLTGFLQSARTGRLLRTPLVPTLCPQPPQKLRAPAPPLSSQSTASMGAVAILFSLVRQGGSLIAMVTGVESSWSWSTLLPAVRQYRFQWSSGGSVSFTQ